MFDMFTRSKTMFLQVTINLLYHCSTEALGWLSSNVEEEWKIHKSDKVVANLKT